MKKLRHILSALLIALIVAMAAGTVVEKFHGNEYALNHVYGSWWFVALWALLAIGMLVMMITRKSWQRPVICALHSSVLLILLGALLTMTTGQHGEMTLSPGKPVSSFSIENTATPTMRDSPSRSPSTVLKWRHTRAPARRWTS